MGCESSQPVLEAQPLPATQEDQKINSSKPVSRPNFEEIKHTSDGLLNDKKKRESN